MATDKISLVRTVMFVGDYFTLITTVGIDPSVDTEVESEDEQAKRLASSLMKQHYGFDVAKVSNSIGVLDE